MNADDPTQLRSAAIRLAGGLTDTAQRASVYHHLYRHSGGNHVFPLLAAHGALWANGYLRRGILAGRILSAGQGKAKSRMAALNRFANAFREINRQVCVECVYVYMLCRNDLSLARQFAPAMLCDAMKHCHQARRTGRQLGADDRRTLFEAFFRWEQDEIVGPAVDRAFAEFDWGLVKSIAKRPNVAFRYLPWFRFLWFRDFSRKSERIAMGLKAFALAEQVGWVRVEQSLQDYGVLPENYFGTLHSRFRALGLKAV